MKSNIIYHESRELKEKYYEIHHPSGLTILVFPKQFSTCYGILGTKFGSADYSYSINGKKILLPDGTAHFLEHKLFENADGVNSDERFSALGADVNAYTTYAATRYLFTATKQYDKCIAQLLEFVTQPYFTEKNVAKERKIIEQEILMYNDDPYETAMEDCLNAMYYNSGIAHNICGTADSIKLITPNLLYEVHKHFYNPNNMILSVCGDISYEKVIQLVDKTIGTINTPLSIVSCCEEEPENVRVSYTDKRMRVSSPIFFIGVKDSLTDDGYGRIRKSLGMTILNNMLFSGCGEFYNRLLSERLINHSFSFGYSSGDFCAMNYFSGISDKPERVLAEIKAKFAEAAAGNLSTNDFERCKRSSLAAFFKSFDSSAEIADDIMISMVSSGVDPFMVPDIIESIKFKDVIDAAHALFNKKDNWTISVIRPL